MVVMDMEDDAVVVEDPSAQMVSTSLLQPILSHQLPQPTDFTLSFMPRIQECVCSIFVIDLPCCAVAGLQFCMVLCAGIRI